MAATSTDTSSIWEDFTFDKISLLIRLRYDLSHSLGISPIINELGFSNEIALKIASDKNFKSFVTKRLDQKLDDLQQRYEEKYRLYAEDINPEKFRADLSRGYINLENLALLSNPFSILEAEKYFDLPETGNIELLQMNWNKKYYSSRCSVFNTNEICLAKAAEYNDLSEYERLYPLIDKSVATISTAARGAIRGGHIDFLKYIIDQDKDLIKDESRGFHMFNKSFLYEAMASKYDNIAMIQYLQNNPLDINTVNMIPQDIRELIHNGSHINNIKYILSNIASVASVEQQINIVIYIMGAIIERGWIDYFKELCSNILNSDVVVERQINGIISYVLIYGDIELLEYILTFKSALDTFLSYRRLETIAEFAKYHDDKTKILEYMSKRLKPSSDDKETIKNLDFDTIFSHYSPNTQNIKFLLNLLSDYGVDDATMQKYYTSILFGIAYLDYEDDYFELFNDITSVYNPSIKQWDELYILALSRLNVTLAENIYPHTSKNSNILVEIFNNSEKNEYGILDIFSEILKSPTITRDNIINFLQTEKRRVKIFNLEDGTNDLIKYILDSGKISLEEVNAILA